MPAVDVVQECFVAGRLPVLASWAHAPVTRKRLWPRLSVAVTADRGLEGIQCAVSGRLSGSAEIWLEPYADGVIVHCYLRADRARRPLGRFAATRRKRAWQRHLSRQLWRLKDAVEGCRAPGADPGGAATVKPRGGGADI